MLLLGIYLLGLAVGTILMPCRLCASVLICAFSCWETLDIQITNLLHKLSTQQHQYSITDYSIISAWPESWNISNCMNLEIFQKFHSHLEYFKLKDFNQYCKKIEQLFLSIGQFKLYVHSVCWCSKFCDSVVQSKEIIFKYYTSTSCKDIKL